MHIGIDASRATVARATGTERYALQMIRALTAQPASHAWTLYFRDPPAPGLIAAAPSVTQRIIPFPRAWTHLRLAAALTVDRPDLLWVPAHTLPFAFPGRACVTVHDLGYLHFPAAHPARQRAYLDLTTRWSAARAAIVLADSRATADDLIRHYRVPAGKIRVVYPGCDVPPIGDPAAARAACRLPERYFLFIGTLQPRKNIAGLVAAYRLWCAAHPDDPAALVLAGGQGWLYDPAWLGEDADGRIIVTGYIDEAHKGALYAGAIALVFPSLYEGFGFPVLEAMACGTPVIASSTSSLPELVGDAGLLVDPHDARAIADAMRQVSADAGLRAGLIAVGRAQAARFTWEAAAEAARAAFEDAVA
jgi:glycosyltransferase involved in cell wall biosynthesis